jgi:hypothetical protein
MKKRNSISPMPPVVESSPIWGGFTQGDPVVVSGRKGAFNFVAHVRRIATGASWVNVYGGSRDPNGERGTVSVPPDQIRRK